MYYFWQQTHLVMVNKPLFRGVWMLKSICDRQLWAHTWTTVAVRGTELDSCLNQAILVHPIFPYKDRPPHMLENTCSFHRSLLSSKGDIFIIADRRQYKLKLTNITCAWQTDELWPKGSVTFDRQCSNARECWWMASTYYLFLGCKEGLKIDEPGQQGALCGVQKCSHIIQLCYRLQA